MDEFFQKMNSLVDELELRARNVRDAVKRHDAEKSDESVSELRLAIAYVKPVTKAMK